MDKTWVWPSVAKTQKAPLSWPEFTLQYQLHFGNKMLPGPIQSREFIEPVILQNSDVHYLNDVRTVLKQSFSSGEEYICLIMKR